MKMKIHEMYICVYINGYAINSLLSRLGGEGMQICVRQRECRGSACAGYFVIVM